MWRSLWCRIWTRTSPVVHMTGPKPAPTSCSSAETEVTFERVHACPEQFHLGLERSGVLELPPPPV